MVNGEDLKVNTVVVIPSIGHKLPRVIEVKQLKMKRITIKFTILLKQSEVIMAQSQCIKLKIKISLGQKNSKNIKTTST